MADDETTRALRIKLVLIHHGDEERVRAISSTVAQVVDALTPFGHVATREIWHQPPIAPLSLPVVAGRRVRQWRLERRWAGHLGVNRRWVLSSGLLAVRLAELLWPRMLRKAGKRACIELALTAKHELAWRIAHEDEDDLLVVLEDDARAHSASSERIRQLVRFAQAHHALHHAFIDLAGGLSREELRLGGVGQPRGEGIISLTSPATNTTCGYAAGGAVVSRLVEKAVLEPASTRLPADWFINCCFLESQAQKRQPQIVCLHSDPHALTHGSIHGAVPSSIRV